MNLEDVIGLGVAGNFAGHLEQAGEAADFVAVAVADATAPKGLFPFYLPGGGSHFLNTFPISSDRIALAAPGDSLQIEPEVALLCDLIASGDRVERIVPTAFAAHNDCSIRKEGARKISEKKNWGAASKGTSSEFIELDTFAKGGCLDRFRIASYLVRDGDVHAYGRDSAVSSYSYFHDQLLDWMVEKMSEQKDEGPLENIGDWWMSAGRPKRALISIGATRYTAFGESTYLREGDRAVVVVYDETSTSEGDLRDGLVAGRSIAAPGRSVLDQLVARQGAALEMAS